APAAAGLAGLFGVLLLGLALLVGWLAVRLLPRLALVVVGVVGRERRRLSLFGRLTHDALVLPSRRSCTCSSSSSACGAGSLRGGSVRTPGPARSPAAPRRTRSAPAPPSACR